MMRGKIYNTDYGWMVKEFGPFGTYLPLHPDTDEVYLVENKLIEYEVDVFGISEVAKVTDEVNIGAPSMYEITKELHESLHK